VTKDSINQGQILKYLAISLSLNLSGQPVHRKEKISSLVAGFIILIDTKTSGKLGHLTSSSVGISNRLIAVRIYHGVEAFRPENIAPLFQNLNITKENVILWLATHLTCLCSLLCNGENSAP
jgi:hypothetical protein